MADFNQPILTTHYATYHAEMLARDVDAYSLAESPTNPPTGAIRYNRALNKFQEWNGSSWVDKVISLAGGGTGGTDANSARTSLGLGTMAIQNNNAVAITGGTIAGVTSLNVAGNSVISGRLDIGSGAANALNLAGGITAGSGAVGIVDTTGKIPAINSTYFASLIMTGDFSISGSLSLPTIVLNGNDPQLIWRESDGPVDEKNYRIISAAGNLLIQGLNDAVGGAVNYITIERIGTVLDLISLLGNVNVAGILDCDSVVSSAFTVTSANVIQLQSGAGQPIVLSPNGLLGLQVTPTGFSHFDDATLASAIGFSLPQYNLSIASVTLGSGVSGPSITIGRNVTGAPATLRLSDRTGTIRFLFIDAAGNLRVHSSAPTDVTGDLIGTVVGNQT